MKEDGESTIVVQAARPVKGLVLRSKNGAAKFSDNFLDILPGDPHRVVCKGLGDPSELEWRRKVLCFLEQRGMPTLMTPLVLTDLGDQANADSR